MQTNQSVQLLQQYFGFNDFRQGQQQVVETILAGQSSAAIFPTGSGKSLCYQLPAIALPNLTLVISPLLALMQDQLQFLLQKGIPAATIDSMQTKEQSQQVMRDVRAGKTKILMISVERLNNERFRQFLKQIPISLLVVDEAHCISEWGHNFRPDYLKLPLFQRQFDIPQVLLLTATATSAVINDMGVKFAIDKQNIITTGFYRENLNLYVKGIESEEKQLYLQKWLGKRSGQSGIVYVTLQQTAEAVALQLKQAGLNAVAYHAGMDSDLRKSIQHGFMDSKIDIIVATIAFGMGIDKSDIRFVVHYELPKSTENYAQEIGRAGRDGLRSECLLLANLDNLNVLENFVYGDTPDVAAIAYVLKQIQNSTQKSMQSQANHNNSFQQDGQWEVILNSLSSSANIKVLTLKTLLVYLELAKVIEPAFSYFAQYKFKLLVAENELVNRFKGERQEFVKALLSSSDKARTWYSVNFERLATVYGNNDNPSANRSRAVAAIDYFAEQELIELQSKQITEVFQVNSGHQAFTDESQLLLLAQKLFAKFEQKETNEIARISRLIELFTKNECIAKQLSHYFSDTDMNQNCGHCSVCMQGPAVLPTSKELSPLTGVDFTAYTKEIHTLLADKSTAVLIARFLCGLTTPIFTKVKARKVFGFAALEQYRFADVLDWVEQRIKNQ